jgi:pantoate--beta-alanine ligase
MTLQLVTDPQQLRQLFPRGGPKRLGLVPTMGALHQGHTSLIELARQQCDIVIVSIFVNPMQFGPNEDFERYPRPLENDLEQCRQAGADVVFTPTPALMYPADFRTSVEVAGLQEGLCGALRPGHFRGVATVVLKLFNLVQPDLAFFGQKDAQQVRIIQQMVEDLNVPVHVVVGPTIRAQDGLALSSRNQYLDAIQRQNAPILYQALTEAAAMVQAGERKTSRLSQRIQERIAATPGAVLDYVALVDAHSLHPVEQVRGATLAALAVRFGATRLIDNILLGV